MYGDFYKNYKKGKICKVRIPAVIYIPKRVLIGICFSDEAKFDTEFPHIYLMQDNQSL